MSLMKSKKVKSIMAMICVALVLLTFILTSVQVSGEDKHRGAAKANSVLSAITVPMILLTIAAFVAK